MKEKKQIEAETKIKNADKQIEAKKLPITGAPGTGLGRLRLWLSDCLEPVRFYIEIALHFRFLSFAPSA